MTGQDFRLYAETQGADGNGHDEPWSYSEKLREFRDDVWQRNPDLAPEDRREHYQRLRDARLNDLHRERESERLASAW